MRQLLPTPEMLQQEIEALKIQTAARYCARDPDTSTIAPGMLGTKTRPDIARAAFEWPAAKDAILEYCEPTGDLYVYMRHVPQTNAALDGILRTIHGFMAANAAFVQGRKHQIMTVYYADIGALEEDQFHADMSDGTTYEDLANTGWERATTTPTYVITPVTIPAGQPDAYPPHRVATPRVILEIEHHSRDLPDMFMWGIGTLEDPLVSAFVGIMVYNRYPDGTFAMLAVLFRRGDMGGAEVFDLVSFGTRSLHPNEMEYIENELSHVEVLRVLPCPRLVAPHVKHQPPPAGWAGLNPTITVPGRDVFWQAPAPSVDPLPDLVVDLWPILDEVAALYNP